MASSSMSTVQWADLYYVELEHSQERHRALRVPQHFLDLGVDLLRAQKLRVASINLAIALRPMWGLESRILERQHPLVKAL
eukprot:4208851-Amphidinium_carterae.2